MQAASARSQWEPEDPGPNPEDHLPSLDRPILAVTERPTPAPVMPRPTPSANCRFCSSSSSSSSSFAAAACFTKFFLLVMASRMPAVLAYSWVKISEPRVLRWTWGGPEEVPAQ
jgi:hypothetical protein